MKKIFVTSVLLILLGLITGCSTYSKKECVEMNWQQRGLQAAYWGQRKVDAFGYYVQECEVEHRIAPDAVTFNAGYAQGLISYCSAERASELGSEGHAYQRICPKEKEADFLNAYIPAKMEYLSDAVLKLKRQNNDLEAQVSSLKSQVGTLESENSSLKSQQMRLQ